LKPELPRPGQELDLGWCLGPGPDQPAPGHRTSAHAESIGFWTGPGQSLFVGVFWVIGHVNFCVEVNKPLINSGNLITGETYYWEALWSGIQQKLFIEHFIESLSIMMID